MDTGTANWQKNLISLLAILFYLFCFISIIYATFGLVDYSTFSLSAFFYQFGKFLALTGFLFIATLIISGDWARWLDKYYGIDRIIKFQRKFAIFTYFIVFSHPVFIILGENSYIRYIIPRFAELPFAAGTISIYIFTAIMLSSLYYKRVSYRAWQYIHILTYVLFAIGLYHAIYTGTSARLLPIKIMLAILVIFALAGAIYRTNYKLRQRRNKFTVEEIVKETPDVFTLIVKPNRNINFEPGQFFFLRLDGRKLYARHPFSMSNSPNEKNLHFTIKLGGRFTKAALALKKGDEVKAEGPFGNFLLDKNKEAVLIAGGVGITPFRSMIKDLQDRGIRQKITVLYSSKTEEDIIFKNYFDSVREPWLKVVHFLTREEKKGYEYGRIDKAMLQKHIKSFKNKKFYLCGPQAMSFDIIRNLKDLGVREKNIFFEDFFW